MRPLRRCFIRLGFLACVGALACGCGSRTVPAGASSPIPSAEPPVLAATPPVLPEPQPPTPTPPAPTPPASPLSTPPLSTPPVPTPPPPTAAANVPTPSDDSACALVAEPGEPFTTVGLSEPVDPANAPHPTNDSERLLFRQAYETLVRVDCEQRLRPGLAASWQLDTSGRSWIVTLREGASFSDGSPVTAADVVESWTRDGDMRPQTRRYLQSVAATGERTLAIGLHDAAPSPLVLANAGLAVARRSESSLWPLGTRGTQISSEPPQQRRSVLTVSEVAAAANEPGGPDPRWSARFLVSPGLDQRDLIDQGVDLVLTRDPRTLAYASTLPQLQSVPLAWRQTLVFVSPWRDRSLAPLTPDARQALAIDAARGEARGAQEPFWWRSASDCAIASPGPRATSLPTAPRIVYERDDEAARDLAERIVGLARASGARTPTLIESLLPGGAARSFQRASGLTREALTAALDRGTEAGYILTIDNRPFAPCRELRSLVDRIRWLDPESIVPLVDTRQRAIVRKGRSGVTSEWDGGLVLARRTRAR